MTRAELEARRLSAIPELDNPTIPVAKLAMQYNVSRLTIYRWRKARVNGSTMKASKAAGRPPKLTPEQVQSCKRAYDSITRQSQKDFANTVEALTGVLYDQDHIGRLMHKWGLTKKRERRNRQ